MSEKYLSKNFTLAQLTFSETAKRLGINNDPTDRELNNLKTLANFLLEPLYKITPFRISSGFRCLNLNRAIKSSDTSHHVLGFAADLVPTKISPEEFAKKIRASKIKITQCIIEFGWVHVSLKLDDVRMQFLVAEKTKSGIKFKPFNS
ncbi:D-Ala-D-Ala carboxypeptidase family metallohydrolase [Polynucleobacter sp.]|uniref:D-Ala-D-Ala carboxypeptidase family metallohydrolase n=1 Tax=Polynucleobacter sp. TaxID=2029855 RepID=UPI003F6A3324